MQRQTPHLPNEIWLAIIAYCESDKDLWLSLRPTNRQLRACVEQHFAENILPKVEASLPMIMPSYDARNPIRGLATFKYHSATDEFAVFELADTGPQFYRENFLGRWRGMQDVDGGRLRESVVWEGIPPSSRLETAAANNAEFNSSTAGDVSLSTKASAPSQL
ncbi:hypothetical protein PRZ48_012351 [Zasmidium cellare]|uniref:F-box domain-containing protein n=1 Tax=Zasmidium cellare TaxID=395010 RepID=A0ABR0E567_ZASCE|nr:hypothetical protein PRZ48_012351 [Zasmidium cellare]